MRRRPTSNNGGSYNNQNRRPRHSNGGHHSGGHHGGGQNRPRKNYSAMREKYLMQAKDALSSGDRVLAENYFQHAEHCYRMMVEEGYNPNRQPQPQQEQNTQGMPAQDVAESLEDSMPNANALPAFITATTIASTAFPSMQEEIAKEPVIAQSWEEQ
jgi:hypothetical protein